MPAIFKISCEKSRIIPIIKRPPIKAAYWYRFCYCESLLCSVFSPGASTSAKPSSILLPCTRSLCVLIPYGVHVTNVALSSPFMICRPSVSSGRTVSTSNTWYLNTLPAHKCRIHPPLQFHLNHWAAWPDQALCARLKLYACLDRLLEATCLPDVRPLYSRPVMTFHGISAIQHWFWNFDISHHIRAACIQ